MTGRFIVLEGLSAAGKNTQSRMLVERLKQNGRKAELIVFPDYATPVGKQIELYLAGKLGPKEKLVEKACLLYALDRYDHAEKIRNLLESEVTVIADRYSPSNYAFQGALAKDPEELWNWIDALEKNLPQPDAVLFLDVPRKQTEPLYANRTQKNKLAEVDIHESDAAFEARVYQNYLRLCDRNGYRRIASTEKGQLLPPDQIHETIWQNVAGLFQNEKTKTRK